LNRNLPCARKILKDKIEELEDWKQRRSTRISECDFSTPRKGAFSPTSPSAVEALNVMKRLINEELLSPKKINSVEKVSFDPGFLQDMIHSLECQMDGLLVDLRAANDALRAKDKLFADLEDLLSNTEAQKEELELRLNKLFGEIGQNQCHNTIEDEERLNHDLAGHLLERFFEDRDQRKMSSSFHRWTCQTSSSLAVERQEGTASKITHELESAQEKLSTLKRHLKKSRKARSSPEYALKRISEAIEQRAATDNSGTV